MKKNTHPLTDFCLAISLLANNCQIVELDRSDPKRIKFCFKDTVELHRLTDLYWERKLTVLPQDFYFALRQLKSRIYESGK